MSSDPEPRVLPRSQNRRLLDLLYLWTVVIVLLLRLHRPALFAVWRYPFREACLRAVSDRRQ